MEGGSGGNSMGGGGGGGGLGKFEFSTGAAGGEYSTVGWDVPNGVSGDCT